MKKALMYWKEIPFTVPDTSTDDISWMRIEPTGVDFALISFIAKELIVYQLIDQENELTDSKQTFKLQSTDEAGILLEADDILRRQYDYVLLDSKYNNLL